MNFIKERTRARGQGGFTLIELLVVIAILGVLAGVVVFAVGSLGDDAEDNACAIELRTVRTAVAAYNTENATDAADIDDLVTGGYLESNEILAASYDVTATPPTQGACPG